MGKKRPVSGVGINDADYVVQIKETIGYVNGKQKFNVIWTCPFYSTWKSMIDRCYSSKFHDKRTTYKDCFVNDEWHLFSNFKEWMQEQKWQDKDGNKLHLDKDILIEGNKEYSKTTCVFIDQKVNKFLVDQKNTRGNSPLGVSWNKEKEKFEAYCSQLNCKKKMLGYFLDEKDAHLAWKIEKHRLALILADEQEDERVAEALRRKYKLED